MTGNPQSRSVGVHCGACGADLGDQYKPGDGAALFEAHIPRCPKGGEPDDARNDNEIDCECTHG